MDAIDFHFQRLLLLLLSTLCVRRNVEFVSDVVPSIRSPHALGWQISSGYELMMHAGAHPESPFLS